MKTELKKWHARNEWYEALDQVHEKRTMLENTIAWAQVEVYEKQANEAKRKLVDQEKNIEKVIRSSDSYVLELFSNDSFSPVERTKTSL